MIFDFHTHCYNNDLAPRAAAIVPKTAPFGPFYDCTLNGLIASMQKNGIDKALTLNQASTPKSVIKVNDWAIECNSVPNIYAFGSIHPEFKDYKAEIARLKQSGVRGLKFHPYYQHFYCDDKSVYAIYEQAAVQDMIMLFHCGNDLLIAGDYCVPQRFKRVVNDFKGAKIVGAHLGGCRMWDEAFDLFLGKDIYLDTSFAFCFLTEEQRARVAGEHSPDRLLFGTDSPWVEPKSDLQLIYKHFSGESLQKVLYKNALTLLGI